MTRDDLYIWRAILDRQNGDRIEHRRITDEDVPAILRAFENDPIWWCFEHRRPVPTTPEGGPYFKTCVAEKSRRVHGLPPTECDIAKATRPRRIEDAD